MYTGKSAERTQPIKPQVRKHVLLCPILGYLIRENRYNLKRAPQPCILIGVVLFGTLQLTTRNPGRVEPKPVPLRQGYDHQPGLHSPPGPPPNAARETG